MNDPQVLYILQRQARNGRWVDLISYVERYLAEDAARDANAVPEERPHRVEMELYWRVVL